MSGRPVQITGMGIVSSIGHDIASFGQSLAEGRSGIKRLDWQTTPVPPVAVGAPIADFDIEAALGSDAKLALRMARRAPFTVQTSIVAATQAWRQAQAGEIAAERIALVVAGNNTTQNYQYSLQAAFRQNPEYLSPRYALQFMDTNLIGALSETFGIKGEGFTVGGASASGNVGIIQGMRLIQAGLADACLVVGVAADLSPMEIQAFYSVGAMGGRRFHDQPEKACRPFDAAHEGFIYGQAAACVVLEAAGIRKISSLATVMGGTTALHATASSDPSIEGEARAMRGALRQAGIDALEVDYVNTHGSSSPLGDKVEIEAIEQVFSERFPQVWLNATKGLTGHCLNSAGVVELIACVVQMQHGFIHPNMNLETPINARARFCGGQAVRTQLRTALSNSFGFGGINTSIVLRK
ncbi:MAG TPA: beta-ketoacyl synthase N-terminal-like domain-containing protein [Reyranella sp.]|nr:beta-ketoacyl synthase N-terminal-like domain-containing protein [Reyranella sp.]